MTQDDILDKFKNLCGSLFPRCLPGWITIWVAFHLTERAATMMILGFAGLETLSGSDMGPNSDFCGCGGKKKGKKW